jgi:hypothetical protein
MNDANEIMDIIRIIAAKVVFTDAIHYVPDDKLMTIALPAGEWRKIAKVVYDE